MKSTLKTTILFLCLYFSSTKSHPNPNGADDPVEMTAKLLIQLDEMIEKISNENQNVLNSKEHLYMVEDTPTAIDHGDNGNPNEERFSSLLEDLKKIEEQIKEAVLKANSKRQYRLVMRLRPLLSYVNQIHRNMEMLRTRVVAIATLSNLAATVSDVLVQFGDVMTSSSIMATGILPPTSKDRVSTSNSTNIPITTTTSNPHMNATGTSNGTTLSYFEDAENFFKNIIQH